MAKCNIRDLCWKNIFKQKRNATVLISKTLSEITCYYDEEDIAFNPFLVSVVPNIRKNKYFQSVFKRKLAWNRLTSAQIMAKNFSSKSKSRIVVCITSSPANNLKGLRTNEIQKNTKSNIKTNTEILDFLKRKDDSVKTVILRTLDIESSCFRLDLNYLLSTELYNISVHI